jgi:2-C-methyl-D-erythritol 4-phosphate cytidylyltransferase
MGADRNKVFLPLGGRPVLLHALEAFEGAPAIDEVLLVAHAQEVAQCQAVVEDAELRKVVDVVIGGATRHQSEQRALEALRGRIESGAVGLVLVHDGARPFVDQHELAHLLEAAREVGGALLATPLAPSELVVEADDQSAVTAVLPNSQLWRAQTPQAFEACALLRAYDAARHDGYEGTDTASTFERAGHRVRVVPGSSRNLKITTPGDLARAESLLRQWSSGASAVAKQAASAGGG